MLAGHYFLESEIPLLCILLLPHTGRREEKKKRAKFINETELYITQKSQVMSRKRHDMSSFSSRVTSSFPPPQISLEIL